MNDNAKQIYASFYEGLAFAQASLDDKPLTIHLPDELVDYSDEGAWRLDFNLDDFFRVVADLDDGSCHYWRLLQRDRLQLWCSESATPANIPDDAFPAGYVRREI